MKNEDFFGGLFGAAIVLGAAIGGAAMMYTGVRDVNIQHQAQTTWRPAQGLVLKSTVVPGEPFRGKAAILNLFYREYRVSIAYAYTVDGANYLGSRLAPPEADSDRGRQGWAEATAAQFQPKQPCEVHYNPDHPEQSYLLCGSTSNAYGRILIGLFLMVLFGLIIPGGFLLNVAAKWGLLPRPRGVVPTEQSGWFSLLPASGEGVRTSLRWLILLTLLWDVSVGATCWHYFAEGVRPLRWGWIDLLLLVVAGLIALGASLVMCSEIVSARRRRRLLFPARAYLSTEQMAPGTTLVVCVEQAARESVRVTEFTATLVDVATGNKEAIAQLSDEAVTPDEPLLGDGDLVVGETAAPTLARIEVLTLLDDGTRASASFTFWAPATLSVSKPVEEKSEPEPSAGIVNDEIALKGTSDE